MNRKDANYLDTLANKARCNDQYLGSLLATIAAHDGIELDDIASRLKCPPENISILSLCKLPRDSAQFFHIDIREISAYSGCDAGELANIVREYQAINSMSEVRQSDAAHDNMLMAARDKKEGRMDANKVDVDDET